MQIRTSYDPVTHTVSITVGGHHAGNVPAPSHRSPEELHQVGAELADEIEADICAEALATALLQVLRSTGTDVITDR